MSAFLGPIHYWLYHKIQLQEALTTTILQTSLPEEARCVMQKELEDAHGPVETRPLEEIIDVGNIHGWLQGKITAAESRFAHLVTKLLETGRENLDTLKQTVFRAGTQTPITASDAQEVFRVLNDTLLDGMPCDQINKVLEQQPDHVCWQHTRCIHQEHWAHIGGDVSVYYDLRDQWITGMLAESDFVYQSDNGTYSVERRAAA